MKTAEVKLAGSLAEHNIAMRVTDHMVDVIKDIFKNSKTAQNMPLGRTQATALAKHVIGCCYFESLSEILTKKISILIDESTDSGNVNRFRIVVRFFDEGTNRVQTHFWKLVQIFSEENQHLVREGATAERLYDERMKSFIDRRPTSNYGVWLGWL